jgi:hypothetical protein
MYAAKKSAAPIPLIFQSNVVKKFVMMFWNPQ